MAKKNNVRYKPELTQRKNTDKFVGEGISSKDFIVLNDNKIGINLPENIIGELGSIDPDVALDIVGGIHATENVEASGHAEFGEYGKFGGNIDGGGYLRVRDEITGGGYLRMGGDIDGGGHLKVRDEITGGGYLRMGGGGTFGGDLYVGGSVFSTGEYNIYGNTYLHQDVFIRDDLLVSGDSQFLDSVVMGDPYEEDMATFSGSEITLGARESGVLAEFDNGIRFYERPTVSGTGVMLIGEINDTVLTELRVDGDGELTGDLTVGGNLYVSGDTFVQSVTDVSVTGDISGYIVEGQSGVFETGFFESGNFNKLTVNEFLGIVQELSVESGITSSGFNVLTEADTGVYNDLFYLNSNPSGYITEAEAIARFEPPPPDPFCFFYDAENHNGQILKTYYPQTVANRPDILLSGIEVKEASDLSLKLRYHGPNYAYAGTGYINEIRILPQFVNEYGTGTRAFNGVLRSSYVNKQVVTGEANGREAFITIEEIGEPPIPTDMYIDLYSNSIPKPGEQQGSTALKEDDKINVFVEFDNQKARTITILDSGISKNEEVYYNTEMNDGTYPNTFTFEDIGGGSGRATMQLTVSELAGNHGFAIKTTNKVLDESEGIDSVSLGSLSGVRLLDQTYPYISASIAPDSGSYSSAFGLNNVTGLHYDVLNSTGSYFIVDTNISNWSDSIDYVTYTKGLNGLRDRYNLYNNIVLSSNAVDFSSAEEVLSSTGDFGAKVIEYKTGFHSEEILRISGFRAANGASDVLDFTVPVENGPQILDLYVDDTPHYAQAPHITGSTEIKGGDKISGFAYVATKGILELSDTNNPADFKNHIEFKLDDYGISEGTNWFHPASVEHYCNIDNTGTPEEKVMFGFAIDVTDLVSRDSSDTFKLNSRIHTDNKESNMLHQFDQDTFSGSSNYINSQYSSEESSSSYIYKAGSGTGVNCYEYEGRFSASPRQVNNGDVPALYLSGVDYPINQSGLKNSETATIHFEKENIDTLYIDDTDLGGAGELNFNNQNNFTNIEKQVATLTVTAIQTSNIKYNGNAYSSGVQSAGTVTVEITNGSVHFGLCNDIEINFTGLGVSSTGSFNISISGTTLIINCPFNYSNGNWYFPNIGQVMNFINSQAGLSATKSSSVNASKSGLEAPIGGGWAGGQTKPLSAVQILGPRGFPLVEKDVSRLAGSYNVSTDNFTISGTKTSNGLRTSISDTVNIANVAPTFTVQDLPASLKSTYGTTNNTTFYIQATQQLHRELSLELDPSQSNQPSLSKSVKNALPTNSPNNFIIGVTDADTRGQFSFEFTGSGIGGQEITSLTNQNYTIGGFTEREVFASHQSLAAGLAELSGVTVQDPNDINMENVSKGGTATNGGTVFNYKSYSDGVQMDNSINFVNQFTTTNSQGITTGQGATHVFNLDKNNRAANAVPPGAKFIVSED